MNTIPQITSAEPKIRIPAWRRASPKNLNTRPLKMSPKACPEKRMMSPSEAIQSRGKGVQPVTWAALRSSHTTAPTSASRSRGSAGGIAAPSADHQDLGVGGQEGLGEHVVEGPDPREGDH